MNCPVCAGDTVVSETRQAVGHVARRRRHCDGCGFRFTTKERIVARDVVKAHELLYAKSRRRKGTPEPPGTSA